jgi:hypothetical protein
MLETVRYIIQRDTDWLKPNNSRPEAPQARADTACKKEETTAPWAQSDRLPICDREGPNLELTWNERLRFGEIYWPIACMMLIGTTAVQGRSRLLLMESEVDSIYSRDRFAKCCLVLYRLVVEGEKVWRI